MICSNKECAKDFDPKTHNQKYCTDECCRVATNRRIMEKYYERKAIKNGSVRQCSKCKAKLSRYNTNTICAHCEKKRSRTKNLLQEIIDEIK
jgi:hypothetical protein